MMVLHEGYNAFRVVFFVQLCAFPARPNDSVIRAGLRHFVLHLYNYTLETYPQRVIKEYSYL